VKRLCELCGLQAGCVRVSISECKLRTRKKVVASIVLTIAKYEVRAAARKFEDGGSLARPSSGM
jgi:hypothetical protein